MTVPLPLSETVKSPLIVCPKTVMLSFVPLTVIVRVVPTSEKATLTPPERPIHR